MVSLIASISKGGSYCQYTPQEQSQNEIEVLIAQGIGY